ncbi:MAG: dolichol-phosphate mannosyltransferase [Candidatus Omnitrophota bacterium]|jgi:dolichol-phosphate mannosyltransferase
MNSTLIIIPTYNESDNVAKVAASVFATLPETDILFVDDNSPDGTGAILDDMAAADPRVQVLHRKEKDGLGRAYIAGFRWALEKPYAHILQMDADLSHDPGALPDMLEAARKYDVAVGSRYIGGIRIVNWPLSRLILSKGASTYVRLVTGIPIIDPTSGYNCYGRHVLQAMNLDEIDASGYSFLVQLKHQAWMLGFQLTEVPIIFFERRSGESKMNAAIIREAVLLVWKIVFRCRFRRSPRQACHPQSIAAGNR